MMETSDHWKVERHVVFKGWQMGSIVGLVAFAPWSLFRKQPITVERVGPFAARSGAVFTVISAALGMAALSRIDATGAEDRVYRLANNTGQIRTDQFSTAGAIGGAALAALTKMSIPGGAAIGTAVAVGLHVLTSQREGDVKSQVANSYEKMKKEVSD
eukprot:Clim_evm77s243 gene=Clim_evmTU77s243